MFLRRRRPYLLALVLGAGSFIGASPALPVSAASAPPACAYGDVPAAHDAYREWDITLLDTTYEVSRSYVPPRLVSTSQAGLAGGGTVRSFVIADLTALAKAARAAGAGLRVVSAYRSYAYQQGLYQQEVDQYGESAARLTVARPGHSEHQLGVTIDFGSASSSQGGWQYNDWGQTSAGSWMHDNAWKFGWVNSYPKNKRAVTCYRYEPWHWRYVGRWLAQQVHNSGLTLREYLWAHYR